MRYLLIFILFLAACSSGTDTPDPADADPVIELKDDQVDLDTEIPAIEDLDSQDIPVTEIVSEDTDSDGKEDSWTVEYESVQLTDDMTMKKIVNVNTDPSKDSITLSFEGSGEVEYIETIPKSFAEHVDHLEFSVQPDEIIDPDPVLKWIIKLRDKTKADIKIDVGGAYILDGESAAVGEAISKLNDIDFIAHLERCRKLGGSPLCMLAVMTRFKEKFKYTDCMNFKEGDMLEGSLHNACKAYFGGGAGECHLTKAAYDKEGRLEFSAQNMMIDCKMWHCTMLRDSCRNLKGDRLDACLHDAAVESDFDKCCKFIQNDVKKSICKVYFSQKVSDCLEPSIPDPECCKALNDPGKKSECLEKMGVEDDAAIKDIDINFEPYADEIETGQYYDFTFDIEPNKGYLRVNWGDNLDYWQPVQQGKARHKYKDQGIYTITANHTDMENKLIAQGELEVETKYPYGRLELLKNTTQVFVEACGASSKVYKDGRSSDYDRSCHQIYVLPAELEWSGRQFSAFYEGQYTDVTHIKAEIKGAINEEGTELVQVSAKAKYTYSGNVNKGHRETEIVLNSMPLEPKGEIPKMRSSSYKPLFIAYVEGSDSNSYIQTITQTGVDGTDADEDYFDYSINDYSNGGIAVVFKSDRVTAYDDPLDKNYN